MESNEEHVAYLTWLDAQTDAVDEEVAHSAWCAGRDYAREQCAQVEREDGR